MANGLPDPLLLIVGLGLLGLAPFLGMMVTAFIKLVVVMHLLRNALGIQQVPPNIVLNALALVLTLFIMAPVATESYDAVVALEQVDTSDPASLAEVFRAGIAPFREFMVRHTDGHEQEMFITAARRIWPPDFQPEIASDHLAILIPSFVVSELTTAFEIGLLIYLPFIAIDLVVSNILLAMGMMMVSPMTISLPFKLLLFVYLDGWTRLLQGLILTYQ
ncbi:type III secretion system export apparatus subunit SctR [uncultured Thiohalocapsa sp.]|uniref:type III secretion system export apparatus subunit SctR n=1 Tax=uncultured Thiohalocapsa sp. TaxID=768990 RepID=UPI0025ED369A|nr:type III secretion system export apparatus subunit SctR [uncultured Thiohalocapsa sp.]